MKIKICGLRREEDIRCVNYYHPDYIGFILDFPKSHRSIVPERARALHGMLDRSIPAVGVTVNQSLEYNEALLLEGIVDIVQLHGQESDDMVQALKMRTGKPIWKAFRIRSEDDLCEAEQSSADLILLDNGYGTGEAFDWTLLHELHRPFALAGGLNLDNLTEAARLHPALLDLSGGAETNKLKDPEKIRQLITLTRRISTCQKEDLASMADSTSPKL